MTDDEDIPVKEDAVQIEYKCTRCGFTYHKVFDYEPFLCYRCLRFIAKKTWTVIHTIQPPLSTTQVQEI